MEKTPLASYPPRTLTPLRLSRTNPRSFLSVVCFLPSPAPPRFARVRVLVSTGLLSPWTLLFTPHSLPWLNPSNPFLVSKSQTLGEGEEVPLTCRNTEGARALGLSLHLFPQLRFLVLIPPTVPSLSLPHSLVSPRSLRTMFVVSRIMRDQVSLRIEREGSGVPSKR